MQISNIIKGWKAYLKNENSELAIKRAEHCVTCPEAIHGTFEEFLPDNTLKTVEGLKCNKCKCPLSAKLRSVNEKCPLNLW